MWLTVVEMIGDAALGLVLWFGPLLAAGHYLALDRGWGPLPQLDQQIGAVVLSLGGDLVGLPFLGIIFSFMSAEDARHAAVLDAALDAAQAPAAAPTRARRATPAVVGGRPADRGAVPPPLTPQPVRRRRSRPARPAPPARRTLSRASASSAAGSHHAGTWVSSSRPTPAAAACSPACRPDMCSPGGGSVHRPGTTCGHDASQSSTSAPRASSTRPGARPGVAAVDQARAVVLDAQGVRRDRMLDRRGPQRDLADRRRRRPPPGTPARRTGPSTPIPPATRHRRRRGGPGRRRGAYTGSRSTVAGGVGW